MTVENQRMIAYILIALGILAILQRFTGSAGWLVVGLIAAAFLFGYISRKLYGLLVAGSILTGIAVGILLEGNWGWEGAFLISLGAGFFAIDQVERRENRWPLYVAGLLAGLGIVVGLLESGILTSVWFAIVLIAAGAVLIARGKKPLGDGSWVEVNPAPNAAPTSATPRDAPEVTTQDSTAVKNEAEPMQVAKADADRMSEATVQSADPPPEAGKSPEDLIGRLEQWRRETARAENRAAYLVLTNESLQLIAENKPQTLAELHKIKGIGKVKLERYGDALLNLLQGM